MTPNQTETGLPRWQENVLAWGLGIVFILLGFLAMMWMFGSAIEGIAEYKTELSRCQKQAVTPYEYHRC